jgi:hypothetical protein
MQLFSGIPVGVGVRNVAGGCSRWERLQMFILRTSVVELLTVRFHESRAIQDWGRWNVL